MTRLSGGLALVPTALLAAAFFALAWREQGSVLAEDWLAYALAAGLLLATLLASGTARRPALGLLAGLAALGGLALWTALSVSWTPVPALARDEALLILFYTLVLAVPLVTIRSDGERTAAVAVVVAASVILSVVVSVRLVVDDRVSDLYWTKRLASPIGYPGAEAAIFLIAFWPAAALAASRRLPVVARGLVFGGAVALLAGWLMTQTRAGTVALGISAIAVFAVAPARVRLLVPVLLAGVMAGASYGPLTAPFREDGPALETAIHDAGTWALALAVAAVAVGFAYALADSGLVVPPRVVRAAGLVTVAAVALGAVAGAGGFVLAVDQPGAYVGDRWREFKRLPDRETGSSHLVTLGSNRYDIWRVALDEFREHPVAGIGGRAFGPAYLREGKTEETPQRGHSLALDVLSETGLVGLALLVGGLLPFVRTALLRARSDLLAAGVLGAIAYWLVHAAGDWTWTFPAVGLPFFLLLGAAAAGGATQFPARSALPAGLAVATAAVVLFFPSWLSARFTAQALEQTSVGAQDELRWARRLDPLSIAPLVAEAELATTPEGAIPALEEAVDREPGSLAPHHLLANAYLDAGRREDARRELREALRLAPRNEATRATLRRLEAGR